MVLTTHAVDAQTVITLVRDALTRECPDRFASLDITPRCALVARFTDGSALYATVAHIGAATAGNPGKPTWPSVPAQSDRTAPGGGVTSMRPGYLAGLIQHLLAGHDGITRVASYAEVGAVGDGWAPSGLRVDLASGTAVYITIVRTSADNGDDPDLPVVFDADPVAAAAG